MAGTLFEWLIEQYPSAKKESLKRMVMDGRVTINSRPAKHVNQPIAVTDCLAVAPKPSRQMVGIDPLRLIYEDGDLLVVNKPAGLLTSTTPSETRLTALAIVNAYVADRDRRARVGLIHRLDAAASGLLVFSKNPTAYESLKRQLFKHEVKRIYAAVVQGVPNPRYGRIESQMIEFPDGHVESISAKAPGKDAGVRAVTEYEVVRDNRKVALLRVSLQTGRKHQIRAHLSERGWPIIGDPMYGPQPPKSEQMLLTAIELEFIHPRTGERAKFEIATPSIMTNMVM